MSELLTDRWFEIPEHVKEHDVQRELLNCDKQYIVIAAGRRSFKTERFIKRDAVRFSMGQEKRRAFCGAPTRTQAKAIFWQDLVDLSPKWSIKTLNKTDLIIHYHNGSELHVVGLEAHKRIEGIMWHRAYITEMQEVDGEFFGKTLEPILNDTGGRGVFEGRPVGKNHFYDLSNMAKVNPEQWAFFTWTSEGVLSEQQIQNAKRSLTDEDYRREYLADFDIGGQLAYYAFSDANLMTFDVIRPEQDKGKTFNGLNPSMPVIVTCDFNANENPMSWTIGQEFNGSIYWYKSLSYKYTNTETMCVKLDEEFKSWCIYPKHLEFYGDHAGHQRRSSSSRNDWQLIQDYFGHLMPKKPQTRQCLSVRDRVGATNGKLKNALGEHSMFIHRENCRPLIDDYERVEWKDNFVELDGSDPRRTHNSDSVDYYNYFGANRTKVRVYG